MYPPVIVGPVPCMPASAVRSLYCAPSPFPWISAPGSAVPRLHCDADIAAPETLASVSSPSRWSTANKTFLIWLAGKSIYGRDLRGNLKPWVSPDRTEPKHPWQNLQCKVALFKWDQKNKQTNNHWMGIYFKNKRNLEKMSISK